MRFLTQTDNKIWQIASVLTFVAIVEHIALVGTVVSNNNKHVIF